MNFTEEGIEPEERKERVFFNLVEQFRNSTDPDEIKILGDRVGRMIFGK